MAATTAPIVMVPAGVPNAAPASGPVSAPATVPAVTPGAGSGAAPEPGSPGSGPVTTPAAAKVLPEAHAPPPHTTPPPKPAPAAREGYLNLNVRPWAYVFIDGKALNKTTPLRKYPLPAGRHSILLQGPDGQELTTSVVIAPGRTLEKILDF